MESKTCISTLSAEDLRLHLLSTNKLPAVIPEKLLDEANVEVLQLTLGHKMKLLSFIKTIKSQQPQEQEKESTGIVACDPTIEYEPIVNENQILDIIVTDQPSNNNVIDFNVNDILNATDEGKVIVQNYLERLEAFITEKERITIVQILVNRLVTLRNAFSILKFLLPQ
ncbi:uncharacterized protein LOC123470343 isoform X2 [Daphnia magna]|uniref:uncharacterized protein LOC123470343 isoform X2 n=1 Tax=Daphnia magna TaxID=35525 RepID=UPI001E1BD8C2|nr:uncharacterized protein LOC123470343 isoform X2 [Daphnia magna]